MAQSSRPSIRCRPRRVVEASCRDRWRVLEKAKSHHDHWSRTTGWTACTPAAKGRETHHGETAGDRERPATPATSLLSIRFASVMASTIRSGSRPVAGLVALNPKDAPTPHIVVRGWRIVLRTEAATRSQWDDRSDPMGTLQHRGSKTPYGPESADRSRTVVHLWVAKEYAIVAE